MLFTPIGVTEKTKERYGAVADFPSYNEHIPDTQDHYILQKV